MPRENCCRITKGDEPRRPAASCARSLSVSVIIPAKDEARSIGSLISKIEESLLEHPHEIVVIDDGSRDKTSEIALSSDTAVVSHEKSLGKGVAMKTGVRNSSGEIIVFLDGDGAHDPRDIAVVIAPILERKADLIIGSRVLPESEVVIAPVGRRLSNNLASFVISVIISFLLPLATLLKRPVKWTRITDCTSGFRAVTREGWHKLDLTSQGFQIETEMIYEAAKNKLAFGEAPISCNWNSQFSRLSILGDSLRTLRLLTGKLIGDIGGK